MYFLSKYYDWRTTRIQDGGKEMQPFLSHRKIDITRQR